MALRTIRELGDPVLSKRAKEVREMTPKLRQLIEDMKETMYEAEGVGLAAPQVGMLKRIVVIDVSEEVMEYGSKVYHELLRKYHECKEMDLWPGYVGEVANDCWLPGWIESEFEEE